MDVLLYGKSIRFELKLTQKLTILFSRMIKRNEQELFRFESFPLAIGSAALDALSIDLKNLYSGSHDIETIDDIDFFQVNFKFQNRDLIAFFDLDRRGDLPVKLEVDFYFKTAQSPSDHITLKEEPFLIIYNNYLYYHRDLEKILSFSVFHKFIDSQYEGIFIHISNLFSSLNLERKFFKNTELLNICRALRSKEFLDQDLSAEKILMFLKAQKNRNIRFKLEDGKVILKPMNSVVKTIKSLVGIPK